MKIALWSETTFDGTQTGNNLHASDGCHCKVACLLRFQWWWFLASDWLDDRSAPSFHSPKLQMSANTPWPISWMTSGAILVTRSDLSLTNFVQAYQNGVPRQKPCQSCEKNELEMLYQSLCFAWPSCPSSNQSFVFILLTLICLLSTGQRLQNPPASPDHRWSREYFRLWYHDGFYCRDVDIPSLSACISRSRRSLVRLTRMKSDWRMIISRSNSTVLPRSFIMSDTDPAPQYSITIWSTVTPN